MALFDQSRESEVLRVDLLELGHDTAAGRLCDLVHVGLGDALDRQDAELCQVVPYQVIDRFLADQNVSAALLD